MVNSQGQQAQKDFFRNERGAVALLTAIIALPLLLAAGVALDYLRASRGQTDLQAALDGAALAVAKAEGLSDDMRIAIGDRYFKSNFKEAEFGGSAIPRFSIKSDRIIAEATVKVPTSLMSLAGFTSIDVGGLSEVMRPVKGRAEIVLVLDYSYSMTDNNKYGRMAAVAQQFVDALAKEKDNLSSLKFGVVPFSDMVAVDLPKSEVIGATGSGIWSGCTQDREYPHNQRETTPTANDSTKWGVIHHFYNPAANLAAECAKFIAKGLKTVPLTDNYGLINSRIAAMKPFANTHIALGAEFGWHLLSPDAPFTEGEGYLAENNHKFLVLLTDGMQTTKGYGPGQAQSTAYAEENLAALCKGMKDRDIVIFTVGYDLTDAHTLGLLQDCASDGKFYPAEKLGDDLKLAFQEIAESIKYSMIYLNR